MSACGVGWSAAVAGIAESQHGVVSLDQLRGSGLSDRKVRGYLGRGQLIAIHRGVYAVGHRAITQRGREQAAVLAVRTAGAFVSHESAARMWGLIPISSDERLHPVHVSITEGDSRPRGVNVHRVKPVFRRDRERLDGVPVASVARTLLDLAGGLDGSDTRKDEFYKAVNEAKARRLVDRKRLARVLRDYPQANGLAALRAQLGDTGFSRSVAEKKIKRLIRDSGLPMPLQNAELDGYEVDFYWPEFDLIVEFNGFAFHSSRQKFEADHVKIGSLRHAGHTVIEISWDLLTKQPDTVVEWVSTAIAEAKPG